MLCIAFSRCFSQRPLTKSSPSAGSPSLSYFPLLRRRLVVARPGQRQVHSLSKHTCRRISLRFAPPARLCGTRAPPETHPHRVHRPAATRSTPDAPSHSPRPPPSPQYGWIVGFGAFAALFAAFGIGANDVANAYATSVGSKALTVRQACFLAVIFEFAGACLAGNSVAKTIRKGIADADCFDSNYMDAATLMYGNLCVVGVVGFWLLFASWAEMPVSTTHSCVGGMIGMTIAVKGSDCVTWYKETDAEKLYIPSGVVGIVLSWVFSPVLSAIFAVALFYTVRTFILRCHDAFNRAIRFYPILIFGAVMINMFFILSKGVSKKICPKGDRPDWICNTEKSGKTKPGVAMGVAAACGVFVAIACYPMYGRIKAWVEAEDFSQKDPEAAVKSSTTDDAKKDTAVEVEKVELTMMAKAKKAMMTSLDTDPHASVTDEQRVANIHANAEKFEPQAEAVFRYIQIFTAICDSFAHGANDVANAMGPFMAIYMIYENGQVSSSADAGDDAYWILALGGLGIGVGLLLYGYKIMRAIGVKLAVITPSRGFAIELGAAIVIIIGSYLGLPLSTTHCQVGATTGVALLEGGKGINTWVLLKTVIGWVITLVVVGVSAGFLVSQAVFAPCSSNQQDQFLRAECDAYVANEYPFLEVVNGSLWSTEATLPAR